MTGGIGSTGDIRIFRWAYMCLIARRKETVMLDIRRIDVNKDIDKIRMIYEKAFGRSEGIIKQFYAGFSEYVNFCVEQNYAYMATLDSEECGCILAYRKPDMIFGEEIYIELLAVLPEYQRKGVGTKLLDKIKEQTKEEKIKSLSLRTGCYMDSYEIYKKYGFIDSRDDHRFMVMYMK